MENGNLYINGQFTNASDGKTFDVINPYTLDIIGTQSFATDQDIFAAINGATLAFQTFKNTTAYERAQLLRNLYNLMMTHEQELAKIMTLEQGKPFSEALVEVKYAASYVKWYAEEGIRIKGDLLESSHPAIKMQVTKSPIGAVGVITPWNFPLAMFVRKIAPALAAGCTVVVKPAEQTPLTAVKFFELIHASGFPNGVCQLVTGDAAQIGAHLMESSLIRKISFTGSTEVGQLLMAQSAKTLKKLSLELGGHAPLIVFEDADVEKAVQGTLDSKFRNCGQTCIATNRVLVHHSIVESYTARLLEHVQKLKYGDGFTAVDMGPIIDETGFNKIQSHIKDALDQGAKLLFGGRCERALNGNGGYMVEPTILTNVTPQMRIFKEETFGPIVPIVTFNTEAEAILLANQTPYGLASYFFTENLSRAYHVSDALEYGMVGVNTGKISTAQAPFGGVKMSGFGREGGSYGIEEYLQTKYIAISL